jgi:ABC-type antimicrobial peptide transport system permease subunit
VALGARTADVVRLAVGQELRLDTGIVAGVILDLFTTRILASLLYGVTPTDPITIAEAALILLTRALLASLLAARAAARVDPLVALRRE